MQSRKINFSRYLVRGFLCSGIVFFSLTAQAATVVTIVSQDKTDRIMSDGHQARIGINHDDYVIVDYKTGDIKMVMSAKQQVFLLNNDMSAMGGKTPAIKTKLELKASGPVIAGYKTRAYDWSANGRHCGVFYGSTEAMKTAGMKPLFAAVQKVIQKQREAMGGFAALMDACTLTNFQAGKQLAQAGIPMRMEKAGGEVISEIKQIQTGVRLPASAFEIPANYKIVTMRDLVRKVGSF